MPAFSRQYQVVGFMKLILASEESKAILINLISSIIRRPVVDVQVRNSEIPPENTQEKAERLDVNCLIDDNFQVDLDYSDLRIIPTLA